MKSRDQIQFRISNFERSLSEFEKIKSPKESAIKFNKIDRYRCDELVWSLDKTPAQISSRIKAMDKRILELEGEEKQTMIAMRLELIWIEL